MKNRYTIGDMRSEVFKVLDEYSYNSEGCEMFSGGTGDMEKRFISALNCALRLVCNALSKNKKNIELKFEKPMVLMEICDIRLHNDAKSIDVPYFSGALSFDFCGKGKLLFYDSDGKVTEEKQLFAEYGNIENIRCFIPENAVKMSFETSDSLSVAKLKSYERASLGACDSEILLPDGKKLYCRFPEMCSELCDITAMTRYGASGVPADIFTFEKGVICCDEKYAGAYRVEYLEYPESYCESDSDETMLELSPVAYTAAVYACAASLCEHENGELYSRLTYKYREILANTYPAENLRRKNSFFSGGIFGRRRKGYDYWR